MRHIRSQVQSDASSPEGARGSKPPQGRSERPRPAPIQGRNMELHAPDPGRARWGKSLPCTGARCAVEVVIVEAVMVELGPNQVQMSQTSVDKISSPRLQPPWLRPPVCGTEWGEERGGVARPRGCAAKPAGGGEDVEEEWREEARERERERERERIRRAGGEGYE